MEEIGLKNRETDQQTLDQEFIRSVTEENPEEKALSQGKISSIEILNRKTENQVFKAKFEDGTLAIFKPKKGEVYQGRKKIEVGTYANRERAAYIVDKFFKFDLVPPTVLRDPKDEWNSGEGSMQKFVDGKIGIESNAESDPTLSRDFMRMAIFDYIINNSDRQENNYIVTPDNKLKGIDNALSFAGTYKKILTPHFIENKPVPEDILDEVRALLKRPPVLEAMRGELFKLLSEDEGDATVQRSFYVLKAIKENNGKLPMLYQLPSFL